jgi:demethylmenaquinone methyltransferase/2-methoxy-6-polyprenyl-1,4-benzoquinol methylase
MPPPPIAVREQLREERFNGVWTEELDRVFADVAPYYDQANVVASLGMWDFLLRGFMDTMELRAGERVLDVCAGTNAVGIALLKREPGLEVHAMDRSAEMQEVGRRRGAPGMHPSVIGDVHKLPFLTSFRRGDAAVGHAPLAVKQVSARSARAEAGGASTTATCCARRTRWSRRSTTPICACLNFTAIVFGSGPSAHGLKRYFINALEMFYSADELSMLLRELGFERVGSRTVLAGMIGFHRAAKPA